MYKLILFIFVSFIVWILFLANTGQSSLFFDLVKILPYGDKIGHFCLFGLLTLIANLAFKFKVVNLGKQPIYIGTLLVIIFVTLEELSQHFIPSRTLDIQDLLADSLGISIFTLISFWLNAKYRHRNNGGTSP